MLSEQDLVKIPKLSKIEYADICKSAIEYAILSIPFTYDRMGISDLKSKIMNISKGKIAENLFFKFCEEIGLEIDTVTTTTPFHQADKKDFLFNRIEFDLKNNYISHDGDYLALSEYLDMPCLIPDKGSFDQWAKKESLFFQDSLGSAYIFSFMKKSDLNKREQFFDIDFSFTQEIFIRNLYEEHGGKSTEVLPYSEDWFWEKFEQIGGPLGFSTKSQPSLVLVGIADNTIYPKFKKVLPSQVNSPYLRPIIPNQEISPRELIPFGEYFNVQL